MALVHADFLCYMERGFRTSASVALQRRLAGHMKIPLNMGQSGTTSDRASQNKILEREIINAKKGDWTAKAGLAKAFQNLLRSLAEKRSKDPTEINTLVEVGKEGLFKAAGKFNPSAGAERFHVFALDFVEKAMDQKLNPGFFARLFHRG